MALTSVILALIGFILPCLFYIIIVCSETSISYLSPILLRYLPIILYSVAIILSAISLAKAKKHGKAIDIPLVGLILGILFLSSIFGEYLFWSFCGYIYF